MDRNCNCNCKRPYIPQPQFQHNKFKIVKKEPGESSSTFCSICTNNKLSKRNGDVMLMGIAKNKKWRKCPKSKCYVEKGDGCLQQTCRCGHDFCYRCGMDHKSQHICPSI